MKKIPYIFTLLLCIPWVSHAQTLQVFLGGFTSFLDSTVLPFLMALAFVFFVIGVIRHMIIDSANEEGRARAKMFALYSILAFLLISTIFAITNLLINSIGIGGEDAPTSDYMRD